VDFQYDRIIPQFNNDVLSFRGSYIRENSSLAATFIGTGMGPGATFPRHHLNTVQGNIEYHFGTKLSGTAGWFSVNGTPDPILFPPAAVSGSANGDPPSNGYILKLSWWPYQNIDLAVQYTGYKRFTGCRQIMTVQAAMPRPITPCTGWRSLSSRSVSPMNVLQEID
jgi:hypothetical protein